jgi:hypothetical protein
MHCGNAQRVCRVWRWFESAVCTCDPVGLEGVWRFESGLLTDQAIILTFFYTRCCRFQL